MIRGFSERRRDAEAQYEEQLTNGGSTRLRVARMACKRAEDAHKAAMAEAERIVIAMNEKAQERIRAFSEAKMLEAKLREMGEEVPPLKLSQDL